MKLFLMTTIALLTLSTSAFAHDSKWLLCQDGKLALNVYEHRQGGDSRQTNLTLIMGSWQFNDQVESDFTGKPISVMLTGTPEDENDFVGTVAIDYATGNGVVTLKGVINLVGSKYPVEAKLVCNELTGI